MTNNSMQDYVEISGNRFNIENIEFYTAKPMKQKLIDEKENVHEIEFPERTFIKFELNLVQKNLSVLDCLKTGYIVSIVSYSHHPDPGSGIGYDNCQIQIISKLQNKACILCTY